MVLAGRIIMNTLTKLTIIAGFLLFVHASSPARGILIFDGNRGGITGEFALGLYSTSLAADLSGGRQTMHIGTFSAAARLGFAPTDYVSLYCGDRLAISDWFAVEKDKAWGGSHLGFEVGGSYYIDQDAPSPYVEAAVGYLLFFYDPFQDKYRTGACVVVGGGYEFTKHAALGLELLMANSKGRPGTGRVDIGLWSFGAKLRILGY